MSRDYKIDIELDGKDFSVTVEANSEQEAIAGVTKLAGTQQGKQQLISMGSVPAPEISKTTTFMDKLSPMAKDAGKIAAGAGEAFLGPFGTMSRKAIEKGVQLATDPRGTVFEALDVLPAAGAIAGGLAGSGIASVPLSGLGAAGGEAYRQLGRRAMGEEPAPPKNIPFTSRPIPKIPTLSKESSNIVTEGATTAATQMLGLGAVKTWDQMAKMSKSLQKIAANSAMGGMKNVFNRTRGGANAFGESAVAMQEKGAFGAFTSPEKALENVNVIKEEAGKKLGETLQMIDDAGALRVNAKKVADKISGDLRKGFDTGYAKALNKTANKIAATIEGYGDEITLKQLHDIKKTVDPGKWGDSQMVSLGEDAKKIFKMRQKAVGKLGAIIDDAVDVASGEMAGGNLKNLAIPGKEIPKSAKPVIGKDIASLYKDAKTTFANADNVSVGLADKVARLQGKQALGFGELGSLGGALSQIFSGDMGAAAAWLATAAGIKYLRSFGPQQGAMIFKALSNSSIPESTLMAISKGLELRKQKQTKKDNK